eukprot:UN23952
MPKKLDLSVKIDHSKLESLKNGTQKDSDTPRTRFGLNSPKPSPDTPHYDESPRTVYLQKDGKDLPDAGKDHAQLRQKIKKKRTKIAEKTRKKMKIITRKDDQVDITKLITQVDQTSISRKKPSKKQRKSSKESGSKSSLMCCPSFASTPRGASSGEKSNKKSKSKIKDKYTPESEESILQKEKSGFLGPRRQDHKTRKTLVLDLDETLVHSSFEYVKDADIKVPVAIAGQVKEVYVRKRPYVDEFLKECAKIYEVVIFTASMPEYANPLLDKLDKGGTCHYRLFRDKCVITDGFYAKDLNKLGRRKQDLIIVDNNPNSYFYQPYNAIPITSWFHDKSDTELKDLLPVLKTTL